MATVHSPNVLSHSLAPSGPPPAYEGPQELNSTSESGATSQVQQTVATESKSPKLFKPVAIPAAEPKPGSPFLRAYSPCLEPFDISKQVFLDFVDKLNLMTGKNPPLQALGLTGSALTHVHLPIAPLVGRALKAASTAATKAVTRDRTEAFLREANGTIFGPHHLKAEIMKIERLASITSMPVLDSEGHLRKTTPLLAPMEDMPWQVVEYTTVQERRLNSLEPWIAPLELQNLPDPAPKTSALSRLDDSVAQKERDKGERRIVRERVKRFDKSHEKSRKAQAGMEGKLRKLEIDAEEVQMDEVDVIKKKRELQKIELEKQKVQLKYGKRLDNAAKNLDKGKEQLAMRKVLWLVIREWHGPQDDYNDNSVPELVGDNTHIPELMGDTKHLPELDGTTLPAEVDAGATVGYAHHVRSSHVDFGGRSSISEPVTSSSSRSEIDGASPISELDSNNSILSELDSKPVPKSGARTVRAFKSGRKDSEEHNGDDAASE